MLILWPCWPYRHGVILYSVNSCRYVFPVHMLEVTELTQALCLTLLFFRLLFFRFPPRSTGREHCSLTNLNIQLEEEKCIAWTFLFWTMALDNPLWGFGSLSTFYLCYFKNNVFKTDYEVLCYVFGKDVRQSWWCVVTRICFHEIKVCWFSAVYKYVFLYLSCISVTCTYKPPPKLGHSLWEWP